MRQVKQEVSTIDEVDVAVVGVGPTVRPRIHDFEVISAVGEVRTPADNGHMPDGEVMIVSEMRAKVRIINPLSLSHVRIVMFLLPRIIVMLIPMLVLSEGRDRSAQQKCPAHSTHYQKSFHSYSSLDLKMRSAPRAPLVN